jgi:hypothetical protein
MIAIFPPVNTNTQQADFVAVFYAVAWPILRFAQ